MKFYQDAYAKKFGVPLTPATQKDFTAAKDLLEGRSIVQAQATIEEFFNSMPRWNVQNEAYALTNIVSAAKKIFPRLIAAPERYAQEAERRLQDLKISGGSLRVSLYKEAATLMERAAQSAQRVGLEEKVTQYQRKADEWLQLAAQEQAAFDKEQARRDAESGNRGYGKRRVSPRAPRKKR